MILKDYPDFSKKYVKPAFNILGVMVGILGILVVGDYVLNRVGSDRLENVYCDAENLDLSGNLFITDGLEFSNGFTRSTDYSRSGMYSSRVDSVHKYGFGYSLKGVSSGERYRVSVWRFNPLNQGGNYLVAKIEGDTSHYEQTLSREAFDGNWGQLSIILEIPEGFNGASLNAYVYTTGKMPVYFDDLQIQKISAEGISHNRVLKDTMLEYLELEVTDQGMRKLEDKRLEAMKEKVLITGEDDWVKGRILTEVEPLPVRLRLKGDQPDHLKSNKWSFRIKMRGEHAWNRLLTFSVQNARARYFLNEWVYHQLMEREDVLATRYDFMQMSLNGNWLGVYAWEEHFEKQLVESRRRREGPIIKFDEDGAWLASGRQVRMGVRLSLMTELNTLEGAEVIPFQEEKTFTSPLLREQFLLAKTLLEQYKNGSRPASEVFDLEKMAKYYALVDINEAYHGIIWHNQRYYYNPVTGKLEPIAFDGFTEGGAFNYRNRMMVALDMYYENGVLQDNIHPRLFSDPAFIREYVRYIDRFTHPDYLDLFFLENKDAIRLRADFIRKEYTDYSYDPGKIQVRAAQIRSLIRPIDNSSLRVFSQRKNEKKQTLKIAGYHRLPLEIVGFGYRPEDMAYKLDDPVFIPAYHQSKAIEYTTMEAGPGMKVVFFRLVGVENKIYYSRISPWRVARASVPVQDIFEEVSLSDSSLYIIRDSVVNFRPGVHIVEENIIIPDGFTVRIPAGTELDLTEGAGFISKSEVEILGEEGNPVYIHSSDRSAQGFTILEASGKSRLSHVRFEHLNTLNTGGWSLTGAVNFYESDVDIRECAFLRNHCEDALNIIRSEFLLYQSQISETAFDGLDADFCEGKIADCGFAEIGNDAMDFSGSVIRVEECRVENVGDKGLSAGEESTVSVSSLSVSDANIGVASKDFSVLTVGEIDLENCGTGFAAYQKKPEYGSANIEVGEARTNAVRRLHLIERGSQLILEGKTIRGN